MNNESQQKYFEQVDQFIDFAKKNSEELENLSKNISALSDRLYNLKSIEELNSAISEIDSNICKINSYNDELKTIYSDINLLENINTDVEKTREIFNSFTNKLKEINNYISTVDRNFKELNIEEVKTKIEDVSRNIEELKLEIENNLVKVIETDLDENLKSIVTEVASVKNSFDEYKIQVEEQIRVLKQENEDIKAEFRKILETNSYIISLFNQMKTSNTNVENYMNNVVEKWYDSNVSFFGKKKNKKEK